MSEHVTSLLCEIAATGSSACTGVDAAHVLAWLASRKRIHRSMADVRALRHDSAACHASTAEVVAATLRGFAPPRETATKGRS